MRRRTPAAPAYDGSVAVPMRSERPGDRSRAAQARRAGRLLPLCALLWACSHPPDRAETWKGASERDLLLTWGVPVNQEGLDSRRRLLAYEWEGPMLEEGDGVSLHCETVFLIEDGRVTGVGWIGSHPGCRSLFRGRERLGGR